QNVGIIAFLHELFHFYFCTVFELLTILIANGNIDRERLLSRPFKCSFHRCTIVEIAAYSKFHMVSGNPRIVCRINTCPSFLWKPGLYPCMRRTLTTHAIFIWTYVTAYITTWHMCIS